MGEALWSAVDHYFNDRLAVEDGALRAALETSKAAGLPSIQISATQGKFLMLLARAIGARSALEIGTLGAYSTIWLARGLPEDGHLVTCELSPKHAQVARSNLQRAGLAERVEVRVGAALDTLSQLIAARSAPFDLVFIDADKAGYPDYLRAALQLSRTGTLIVADNVVREGRVVDEHSGDADTRGIRAFIEQLSSDPSLLAVALQTVGERGHDGFSLALVGSRP
jgi:predicted O-methyltransferase YrrM